MIVIMILIIIYTWRTNLLTVPPPTKVAPHPVIVGDGLDNNVVRFLAITISQTSYFPKLSLGHSLLVISQPAPIFIRHASWHNPRSELHFGGESKDRDIVGQRSLVPQRVLHHLRNPDVPVGRSVTESQREELRTCAPLTSYFLLLTCIILTSYFPSVSLLLPTSYFSPVSSSLPTDVQIGLPNSDRVCIRQPFHLSPTSSFVFRQF